MQLFLLLMMIAAMLGNQIWHFVNLPESVYMALVWFVGPYVMTAAVIAFLHRIAHRQMIHKPAQTYSIITKLDRLSTMIRWSMLALFIFDVFALGWVRWLETVLGDWILINDIAAIAPPIAVFIVGWWSYYPIDRRLREATLIRQIDSGQSVYPILTAGQYVISQCRHQLLLILLPILILRVWMKMVEHYAISWGLPEEYDIVIVLMGSIVILLMVPLIIRYVWDTVKIPQGELRSMLTRLCDSYGVRVRELLLWRTHGRIINGAVMGFVSQLRFILLTDSLIEQLPPRQIEAVMAHELGHIRQHHIPWLVVCALGSIGLVHAICVGVICVADTAFGVLSITGNSIINLVPDGYGTYETAIELASMPAFIVWPALFGYISRRFERQADTFAVKHLAIDNNDKNNTNDAAANNNIVIDASAVAAMSDALSSVASLNHTPTNKHSWRHGSTDWRIAYLNSLKGLNVNACPIDRHVKWIQWGSLAMLVISVLLECLVNASYC